MENISYSQAKKNATKRLNFAQNYMKCDDTTRQPAIDDHGFTKDGWYVHEWAKSGRSSCYAIVGPNNRYFSSIKEAKRVHDDVKLYNFQCTNINDEDEVCGALKEATANSQIDCKHCNKTNRFTPTEEEMKLGITEIRTWKLVTSEETTKIDFSEIVNEVVAKNETDFENFSKSQENIWSTDSLKIKFVLREKREQLNKHQIPAIKALGEHKMNDEMIAVINRCKDRHPEKKEELDTLLTCYIAKEPLPQEYRKVGIKRSSILEVNTKDSVIPSYDECIAMLEEYTKEKKTTDKKKNTREKIYEWNKKAEYAKNIDMLMLIKDVTQNSINSEDIALLHSFEESVGIAAKKHEQGLSSRRQQGRDKNIVDGETVENRVENATDMMGSICLVDSKVSNAVVDRIGDELDKGDGKELSKQEMQAIANDIRRLLDDSMA